MKIFIEFIFGRIVDYVSEFWVFDIYGFCINRVGLNMKKKMFVYKFM